MTSQDKHACSIKTHPIVPPAVLLPCYTACSTWEHSKHCLVHSVHGDLVWSDSSLGTSFPSQIWHCHIKWRRTTYSSTSMSSELSHISHTYNNRWSHRITSTQSKMCKSATLTCDVWECIAICHGKRLPTSCMWRSYLQWTRWMHSYLYGSVT